jgi:hypothetical protein
MYAMPPEPPCRLLAHLLRHQARYHSRVCVTRTQRSRTLSTAITDSLVPIVPGSRLGGGLLKFVPLAPIDADTATIEGHLDVFWGRGHELAAFAFAGPLTDFGRLPLGVTAEATLSIRTFPCDRVASGAIAGSAGLCEHSLSNHRHDQNVHKRSTARNSTSPRARIQRRGTFNGARYSAPRKNEFQSE